MALATVIGCFVGWWWDRPGKVRPRTLETPWETRAQWSAAIAWPMAATISAVYPIGAYHLLITCGLTAAASLIVGLRLMAARARPWPLHTMARDVWGWLRRSPLLVALLVMAVVVLPWWWSRPTVFERPGSHAIPVLAVVGATGWIALREARWRTKTERLLPRLAAAHGVREGVMETARLRPGNGREFVMVHVPAQVVTQLDGLDSRLAVHLPEFEARVRTGPSGVTSILYRPTGVETVARREVLVRTNGLVTSLVPTGTDVPARPDEHFATIAEGVSPVRAAEIDAVLREAGGFSLVHWRDGSRTLHVARLDAMTLDVRGRLAAHLPGTVRPWDLDLACEWEGDLLVAIVLSRFPAITDPAKRREVLLAATNAIAPSPDERGWSYSDLAPGHARLALVADPLDVHVPFDAALGDQISPDTPWRVGIDEDGEPIEIDLAASAHMLIAGATRSGKSVCTYGFITHVLRMRDAAQLLVADPNDTTVAPFESRVAWSTTSTHPDDVTSMLEWVRKEMDRRKPILREMRADKISDFTTALPMIVVVIDEAANYLRHNDKPAAAALAGELLAVVSQGAKYGIRLVLITQRPDSTILPTATRAQLSARICFRVEDKETALMAFPNLPEPEVLLSCKPGVGWIREVGGKARRFRGVYMADHWAAADGLPFAQPKIDLSSDGLETTDSGPHGPEPLDEIVTLTLDDLEAYGSDNSADDRPSSLSDLWE